MDPWIKYNKAYQQNLKNSYCWKGYEKTLNNIKFRSRLDQIKTLKESEILAKNMANYYKRLVLGYGVHNNIITRHKTNLMLDQLKRSKFRNVKYFKSHLINLRLNVN